MEELLSRITSDLESNSISHQALLDLQTLVDKALESDDPESMERFYEELASRNLSPSSLTASLASAMDMGQTKVSLLASKVYTSLLLSPSPPVFTLFTPLAFLSLLRSIRRSIKPRLNISIDEDGEASQEGGNRKRNGAGRGKRVRKRDRREDAIGDVEGGDSDLDVGILFCVLQRLEAVLGVIHLDRFPDSLKSLIQTVAEFPVMGLELFGNSRNYSKLIEFCSRVLSEVLGGEHGEQANSAAEVLRCLSPLILMGNKSPARTFAMGFVTRNIMGVAKKADGVKKAVLNLPKYLVQKAPEKSEPRALAVESIMEIVQQMESEDQKGFVNYVVKMTQGKLNLRLLAVDLIPAFVMSLGNSLNADVEGEANDPWGAKCLKALTQRCSDGSAGIRARALSNLAQLVGHLSGDDRNNEVLKEVLKLRDISSESRDGGIINLLRDRCMDEKAAVRKSAIHLVTKLTTLSGYSFDPVVLKMLGMACSDPLVSIRKASILALSEVFRTYSDKCVAIEWLHSVPRLITDNESSIQEECENLFLELVLDRISRAGSGGFPNRESKIYDSNDKLKSVEMEMELLFPEVLYILKELCDGEVTPWVKKICTSLGKKKRLKPKIAIALQKIIETSESLWLRHSLLIDKWTAPPGAWLLLSEVSLYLPKSVEWEFLHHHWQLLDKHKEGDRSKSPNLQKLHMEEGIESNSISWAANRVFLLETICNVSMELPDIPAADLAVNLLSRIEEFNMHSTEVNAHVKALSTLCKRKSASDDEANALTLKWVYKVLSKASHLIEKYIEEVANISKNNSFRTPPTSSRKGKRRASKSLLQATTAVYTIGSMIIVCPSATMSSIIPLLHSIITSGNNDPKVNKLPGPTISFKQAAPSLYVQAWLTMGKICLADGKLAKRYIPLFVQELEKTDCAAVRNNLVVIMADFCVYHTALVDCYIAKITKCLRDPCELVRRQTFILLSRLLQRDYVKGRGVLFLRFLLSLVDESEKIRQLAEFLIVDILNVKTPLIAYNNFVEAIFVLNDCYAHNGRNESRSSRAENRLFSIRGNNEESRSKRMHIYTTLLKQMAPGQHFVTFAKLCSEILAAACDGMMNIEDVTVQSVLQDVFQILSCKEIKFLISRGSSSESADLEEEGGDNGAPGGAANGRATSQEVRKGLIQNSIPIFIALKRLLESKNSPLIGSLMECLRNLLKDYKNEIDDMLVADRQLQKELLYDMQKFEQAKAKSIAAEALAQNSGKYRTPDTCRGAGGTHNKKGAESLQSDPRIASAMADAAAEETARSVLRAVSQNILTPPLSSMKRPPLKSNHGQSNHKLDRPLDVLESLRKRHPFDDDD